MLGQTNSEVSFYTLVYSAFSVRINEEEFFNQSLMNYMYFLTFEFEKRYYSLSNQGVVYLSICQLFACHPFQTFAGSVLHLIISVIYFPNFIFVAYILFGRRLYI